MNRTKVLLGTIVAALLVVGAVFLLKSNGTRSAPTELKIGALLPLTGEAASYGVDCRQGVEVAVDEARKKSIPVTMIYEDTKADPKEAVAAFNKLANVNKVSAILGDMFSSTTLAIAPLAQQAGITLLTPTAADEKIPATGDLIFSIYPSA